MNENPKFVNNRPNQKPRTQAVKQCNFLQKSLLAAFVAITAPSFTNAQVKVQQGFPIQANSVLRQHQERQFVPPRIRSATSNGFYKPSLPPTINSAVRKRSSKPVVIPKESTFIAPKKPTIERKVNTYLPREFGFLNKDDLLKAPSATSTGIIPIGAPLPAGTVNGCANVKEDGRIEVSSLDFYRNELKKNGATRQSELRDGKFFVRVTKKEEKKKKLTPECNRSRSSAALITLQNENGSVSGYYLSNHGCFTSENVDYSIVSNRLWDLNFVPTENTNRMPGDEFTMQSVVLPAEHIKQADTIGKPIQFTAQGNELLHVKAPLLLVHTKVKINDVTYAIEQVGVKIPKECIGYRGLLSGATSGIGTLDGTNEAVFIANYVSPLMKKITVNGVQKKVIDSYIVYGPGLNVLRAMGDQVIDKNLETSNSIVE